MMYTRVPDPYVFGPLGSASLSVSQKYVSKEPDPHLDPYQNVTDHQHCLVDKRTNTGEQKCGYRLSESGTELNKKILKLDPSVDHE